MMRTDSGFEEDFLLVRMRTCTLLDDCGIGPITLRNRVIKSRTICSSGIASDGMVLVCDLLEWNPTA